MNAMLHPIFNAILEGDFAEISEILKNSPGCVSEVNQIGESPLIYALVSMFRTTELIRSLINAGADPRYAAPDGRTALLCAVGLATNAPPDTSPEIIEVLVKAGSDLEARNHYGWTPLVEAIMGDSSLEVKALIKCGANPLVILPKDTLPAFNSGVSSLGIAFMFSDEILRILLEAGADPLAKDAYGRTLLEFATKSLDEEMTDSGREDMKRRIDIINEYYK
jgi:ankyrin repeat protein